MQSRTLIFAAALVVIVFGAAATISDVVRNGPTPLALASLLVLAMFAFGIVGALRHPEGP
jgi:succinate dehydrogenase hydrophobic anchor subunit